MKILIGSGLCLTAALGAPTMAEDMGFYIGGSVGSTALAVDNNFLDQDFAGLDLDDSANGWKGYAGIQFLPFISVEGGYTRFGDVSDVSPLVAGQLEAETIALFARGTVPMGPLLVFGKAGYHFYDADVSLEDIANSLREGRAQSGGDFALGAGAGVELGPFTFRAEYEVFLVDGIDDLQMISVGASYSF